MLDTATHCAGPIIKIGQRYIQRCCICGEKLGDNAESGLGKFWSEGEIVRARNDRFKSTGREFLMLKKLPQDFCAGLLET